MILTTKLSTLTAVNPRLLDLDPRLVNEARYCIFLNREVWDPPRMDNIVGGYQEPNLLVDGYHEGIVDLQKVVRIFCRNVRDLFTRCREIRKEVDIFIEILVTPFPLVTGNLNLYVGLGGIVQIHQRGSRGNRHRD